MPLSGTVGIIVRMGFHGGRFVDALVREGGVWRGFRRQRGSSLGMSWRLLKVWDKGHDSMLSLSRWYVRPLFQLKRLLLWNSHTYPLTESFFVAQCEIIAKSSGPVLFSGCVVTSLVTL